MKKKLAFGLLATTLLGLFVATPVYGDVEAQTQGWWTASGSSLFPSWTGFNLGIGTTAPASRLHVVWGNTAAIKFNDAAVFENGGNTFVQVIGGNGNERSFNFASPSHPASGAIKYNQASFNGFSFWTDGNQLRQIMYNNGNVWQGGQLTVAPAHQGFFGGMFTVINDGTWEQTLNIRNSSNGPILIARNNGRVGIGVEVGSINNILQVVQNSPTDPIADAWTVYSSRRWKTNIETFQDALGIIDQLRGVTFDWKDSGRHDIGLIAEEVGQVVPEAVAYEANGVDAVSIDYARVTPILIEAIKEQQRQIDQLQETIDSISSGTVSQVVDKPIESADDATQVRIAALEQEIAELRTEKASTDQDMAALEARLTVLEAAGSAHSVGDASLSGAWTLLSGLLIAAIGVGSRFLLK